MKEFAKKLANLIVSNQGIKGSDLNGKLHLYGIGQNIISTMRYRFASYL